MPQDAYGPLMGNANNGVGLLYESNDIAIIALTTCLIFALIANAWQYHQGNKRQEKDFTRYLALIEALAGVRQMLAVINQKIGEHEDDQHPV